MTLKAIFLHGIVVIDGFLVAPLGEVAIAAMGVAGAIGGIIIGFIFAFAHAMQIRAAQAFGHGDQIFLKSVLVSGFTVSMAIGCVGVTIILVLGESFVTALAPTTQIAQEAWSYLLIFCAVIIGQAVGTSIVTYFNGCGRTKIPLIGYCLSVPINIVSSFALIYGAWGFPELGVAGAAWGTALGVFVQAVYLIAQLHRTDGHLRKLNGWRNGTLGTTLTRHVVFSVPIAATFISANFARHVCVLIYAKMALPAFAALTLIMPWNMVAGQISMQWTQATGIFVAQMLGNQSGETALDRFIKSAWRGAFVTSALVALVFVFMCLSLNWIYPDLTPETRAILFGFLPVLVLIQPIRATNALCGNTLRASGDTIYVMHLFIWSQWAVRVPLTALLVLYFNVSAFWILAVLLLEEVVKFPFFHRRMFQGRWKTAVID